MPQLLPFAGLRPQPSIVGPLDDFVCPPYDVITEPQRLGLLARSPYNIVRVELPAGDYSQAARLLAGWKAAGALAREGSPVLYGYRMSYPGPGGDRRSTVGVIGALVLEALGQGVLPHEQTTPKAKTDRLELLRATRANISPIWCLCPEPGLTQAVEPVPSTGLVAAAHDRDGNTHEIWPLLGPGRAEAVGTVVGARPLLVADGHHRYETGLAYRAETGAKTGAETGPKTGAQAGQGPEAIMALVVELSDDQLQVLGTHRVVSGLPGDVGVLSAFTAGFDVSPARSEISGAHAQGQALLTEMTAAGAVGVVTAAGAFLARPRPGTPSAAYDLDSSRVDGALEALPGHDLTYEHDVAAALAAVARGQADGAVLCRPATVAQIAATASGGRRMPPKTTFFWPKPLTGMVLRDW